MDSEREWRLLMVERLSMQGVLVAEKDSPLRKLLKIPQAKDFIRIKKTGVFAKRSGLVVRYIPDDKDIVYWGVAASKFAYRKAVDRNLAKRRLRMLISQKPPLRPGYYLVTATVHTNKISYEHLQRDYESLVRKVSH